MPQISCTECHAFNCVTAAAAPQSPPPPAAGDMAPPAVSSLAPTLTLTLALFALLPTPSTPAAA